MRNVSHAESSQQFQHTQQVQQTYRHFQLLCVAHHDASGNSRDRVADELHWKDRWLQNIWNFIFASW
jgi:hypothetical protein